MCTFTGPVLSVRKTRIFARTLPEGRQLVVYETAFAAAAELAMVQPIPVAAGSGDGAVKVVDLSHLPAFFDRLDKASAQFDHALYTTDAARAFAFGTFGLHDGAAIPPHTAFEAEEDATWRSGVLPYAMSDRAETKLIHRDSRVYRVDVAGVCGGTRTLGWRPPRGSTTAPTSRLWSALRRPRGQPGDAARDARRCAQDTGRFGHIDTGAEKGFGVGAGAGAGVGAGDGVGGGFGRGVGAGVGLGVGLGAGAGPGPGGFGGGSCSSSAVNALAMMGVPRHMAARSAAVDRRVRFMKESPRGSFTSSCVPHGSLAGKVDEERPRARINSVCGNPPRAASMRVEARCHAARGQARLGSAAWETTHLDASSAGHHDALMRTTLTLDPDVATMVEEEVHRLRKPFKQVVNDALRRGLAPRVARGTQGRYRVRAHEAGLRPGVDIAHLNALVDEMDITEGSVTRPARRRGRRAS